MNKLLILKCNSALLQCTLNRNHADLTSHFMYAFKSYLLTHCYSNRIKHNFATQSKFIHDFL